MTIKPTNNLFPLYAYQEGMEWNPVYFNAPGISLCLACGDCTAACSEGAIRIKVVLTRDSFSASLTQHPELTPPNKY